MALNQEQSQKILTARPDVAKDPYYSKNVGEWWKKYGQEEIGQQVLQTRPDVAADEYYGSNPSEWFLKYGLDTKDVLGAPNVQQTQQAPVQRPDDLLDIRSQMLEQLGVPKLQEQYSTQMTAYNQLQTDLATRYQERYGKYLDKETAIEAADIAISGQPLSIGKILGQQAQAKKLSDLELKTMNRSLEVMAGEHKIQLESAGRGMDMLTSQLQSAQTEAESRFGIKSKDIRERRQYIMQYPTAGITFGDSYESMATKVAEAQVKEKDSERIYDLQSQYPGASISSGMDWDDALKSVSKYQKKQVSKEAFADTFGYYPEGLSSKEVTKKLESYYKSEKQWLTEQRDMEKREFEKAINKPYYEPGGDSMTKDEMESSYRLRLREEADQNTGYLDAGRLLSIAEGYHIDSGKKLDRKVVESYLSPGESRREEILNSPYIEEAKESGREPLG